MIRFNWIGSRALRTGVAIVSLGCLSFLEGCDDDRPDATCAVGACEPGSTTAGTVGGTGSSTTMGEPGTAVGAPSDSGAAPVIDVGSRNDAGTGGPQAQRTGLPCDVQRVVYDKCSACHQDPPVSTYMPLLTHAHFHAPSTSEPARPYYELANERVHASEEPMPPVTSPALTESEKEVLGAWLDAGAPKSSDTCLDGLDADGGLPGGPDDGQDIDTSGLECFSFVAHADGDYEQKFPVGAAQDAYFNMYFKAPWQGNVYAVIIKPVVDNAQALHHWLLYRTSGGQDAVVERSSGQHSDAELIHGWAPGGIALDFRDHMDDSGGDVAFELDDSMYLLEMHYNSSDPAALDASGAEVCIQRDPPAHIAATAWLGYDHGAEGYIAGAVLGTWASGACLSPADRWEGTCDPIATEPVHVMYVTPHMHEAGVHMSAQITGPNGTRPLHDEPFDFNYQVAYEKVETIMPGETITTVCEFSEPKCSGQATNAEMCYLYAVHWPKGQLTDNGSWGQLAHGENVCLGQ